MMTNATANDMIIIVNQEYAPLDYLMDPSTDDLIRGDELKEGMVVLIEDVVVRNDPQKLGADGTSTYDTLRIYETARWCLVTKLHLGQIISFVGVYGDGTKMSRSYNHSFFWFVKI
jgi:hypothetical protein